MTSFALLPKVRIFTILLTISVSLLSFVSAQERKIVSPCDTADSTCTCRYGVVSCDFKSFTPQTNSETVVEVDGTSISASIRRVCLCNFPKSLRLFLGRRFLPNANVIHRVDLYNIKGYLDVEKAFQTNFGGELYAENISNWTRIRRLEFGRAFDFDIIDTREYTCCSKISAPKLEMPALYMKNVNVTYIEHRGIDDMHGWKNVIFNNLRVTHGAETNAITFSISGMNVSISILNSEFRNTSAMAIYLRDAADVILARSSFHHSCDQLTFVARSNLEHSALALIHNVFLNTMILQTDARNVINWFNRYDFWHPGTFLDFAKSKQKARTISMEFNTVEKFVLSESNVIPTREGDSIVFNENILSNCTCPMSTPKIFQQYTNRCLNPVSGNRLNEACAVDILKIKSACSSNSNGNFQSLCKDKDSVYITDSVSSRKKTEFRAKTLSPMSAFISEQLKYIEVSIHDHELLQAKNGAKLLTKQKMFIHMFVFSMHLFFKCL